MVWCAATLWAETSEGSFRQRWLAALSRYGVNDSRASASPRDTTCFSSDEEPDASKQRRKKGTGSPRGEATGRSHLVDQARLSGGEGSSDDEQRAETRRKRAAFAESQRRKRGEEMQQSVEQHVQRATEHLGRKKLTLQEQRRIREHHTQELKTKSEQLIQTRVEKVKDEIRLRNKRFLPVIDQCETDEERDALRAASFRVAISAFLVVVNVQHKLRVARYMLKLRLVLSPMVRFWLRRRFALARAYVAIWRGRCPRPSVRTLQSVFTPVANWSVAAVQKLIHTMQPMAVPEGRRIFTSGEPGVSALYVSYGRVAVRQRRLNASDLELGERGSTYVHGEDMLTKEEPIKHYCNVVALEATSGWYITRKAFRRISKESSTVSLDLKGAASFMVSSTKATKIAETTEQIMRGNPVLLHGWHHDDLTSLVTDLLEKGERNVPRGDCLYRFNDRATTAFVVLRGTVLLAQQTRRSGASAAAGADGVSSAPDDPNSGKEATTKGGGDDERTTAASAVAEHHHGSHDAPHEHHHNSHYATHSSGSPQPLLSQTSHVAATAASPLTSLMCTAVRIEDVDNDGFHREYANSGQIFGHDALLLGSGRCDTAFAATDCAVMEIPFTVLMNGMLTDPNQLWLVKRSWHQQRASRIIPPIPSELAPFFAHQSLVALFIRHAFPISAARGDALPLRTSLVFLQMGSVEMILESSSGGGGRSGGDRRRLGGGAGAGSLLLRGSAPKAGGNASPQDEAPFKAPTVLIAEDVLKKLVRSFHAAIENGTLSLVKAERQKDGGANAAAAGSAISAVRGGRHTVAVPRRGQRSMSVVPAEPIPALSSSSNPSEPTVSNLLAAPHAAISSSAPATSAESDVSGETLVVPEASISLNPVAGAEGEGGSPSAAASAIAPVVVSATATATSGASDSWAHIPLAGSQTLVVKPPFSHDVRDPIAALALHQQQLAQQANQAAGGGGGAGLPATPSSTWVRYRQATPAVQLDSLAEDLLEGVPAPQHKCLTRCEGWGIRLIDIVRRFYHGAPISVRIMEDILAAGDTLLKLKAAQGGN